MSLKDEILKQSQKHSEVSTSSNIQNVIIEQTLNKLFDFGDKDEVERSGLHASSIIAAETKFCFREQVLSLLFKQTQGHQLPSKQKRVFEEGKAIHRKWQGLFERSGIADEIELRHYEEKYDLYFTPDAVVKINSKKYVVEIKSMNSFQYQKATSHPSGQKQLELYMHLLGIRDGFVLAEDKNTQDFKVFILTYDYERLMPIISRLETVVSMRNAFLSDKEIPARTCKNSDCSRANECNMKDACFNIGIGRVRL